MSNNPAPPAKVVAVTPNPAVDVTYVCPEPELGEVNRVRDVIHRPGGKGLNVAAGVQALDHPVCVSGFLGGRGGAEIKDLLAGSGIAQDWVGIDGETRSTVAVHADAGTTMFNEPGPPVDTAGWQALAERVAQTLTTGDVFTLSGSCPPGTREDDLAVVLNAARAAGARIITDTSGPMLVFAASHADVLKPNREEILAATGCDTVQDGALFLLDKGASAIVVSDGEAGMLLFTSRDDGYWSATPPQVVSGNPTGAGDASVAALAVSLLEDPDEGSLRPESLQSAVAFSAAAVLRPTAGDVDLNAYREFLPDVTKEYINAAR